MGLLTFTDRGIYCAAGDFYIDPWKPVHRAVITHAHSDHARAGSDVYLCHHYSRYLLQLRLGPQQIQSVDWNESVYLGGVRVSLHPAGHIIGSAQIRIESGGEVWVVSGDYKIEDDGISEKFEPVPCHVFITESTFGLPVYNWKAQQEIFTGIRNWILKNRRAGKNSVLLAYSLGKAQRLLAGLRDFAPEIYVHTAIWNAQQALKATGIRFPEVIQVSPGAGLNKYEGAFIIAPPGSDGSPWINRFSPYVVGVCSGWMQVRGFFRRRNADAGFALSDHADWSGLLQAVEATGAQKIYVTHGFQAVFARVLTERGKQAEEVITQYGEEESS